MAARFEASRSSVRKARQPDHTSDHQIACGVMGELILIRHGETEWSRSGQHAYRTDIPLTDAGVAAARALTPVLARRHLVAAFSSPLRRAMQTAELVGLTDVKPDPDLLEWDYGGYEGLTAEQIRETRPGWELWRDGVVPGDMRLSWRAASAGGCAHGCCARPDPAAAEGRQRRPCRARSPPARTHRALARPRRVHACGCSATRVRARSAPWAPSMGGRSSPPGTSVAAARQIPA